MVQIVWEGFTNDFEYADMLGRMGHFYFYVVVFSIWVLYQQKQSSCRCYYATTITITIIVLLLLLLLHPTEQFQRNNPESSIQLIVNSQQNSIVDIDIR